MGVLQIFVMLSEGNILYIVICICFFSGAGRLVVGLKPLPLLDSDRIEGIWDPRFDPDGPKPLLFKSEESLIRSRLSCDWSTQKLQHIMTCIKQAQMMNR